MIIRLVYLSKFDKYLLDFYGQYDSTVLELLCKGWLSDYVIDCTIK